MSGKMQHLSVWLVEASNYDLEVILIHDIQDEATSVELEEIVNSLKPNTARLISGYWGNPGGARNAGLETANGTMIAFWDADDLPNLSVVFDALTEKKSSEIVIFDYEVENYLTKEKLQVKSREDDPRFLGLNPGLWRMVFKREFLTGITFPNILLGEDQVLFARVLARNPRIEYVNKSSYTYMVNFPGQITNSLDIRKKSRFALRLLAHESTKESDFVEVVLVMECKIFLGMFRRKPIHAMPSLFKIIFTSFKRDPIRGILDVVSSMLFVLEKNQKIA
jgi:glycosyltransferase involved in cell wall biosynthesis